MATFNADNCTSYPPLQPNPDVSGIGVLTGFLVTAYTTLFLCIAYYLIDSDGSRNPMDRLLINRLQALFRSFSQCFLPAHWNPSTLSGKWIAVLRDTVLAFSDQQVITSIAILASGFSQLSCGLSSYHWQYIVNLAWFSSVTHLTTLTTLRVHLQRYHAQRSWRLVATGITAVMLVCGLCSTGYLNFSINAIIFLGKVLVPLEFPAWCLFHANLHWNQASLGAPITKSYNSIYIVFALVFHALGYISRVALAFSSVSSRLEEIMYTRPRIAIEQRLQSKNLRLSNSASKGVIWVFRYLWYKILYSFYVLSLVIVDLYGSMFWEITWLLFILLWGSLRILMTRNLVNQQWPDVIAQENVWGFGQVIAVLLLALPFVGFYEAVFESIFGTRVTTLGSQITANRTSAASLAHEYGSPPESSQPFIFDVHSTSWFPKIICLQYLISLLVMGDMLFEFAYGGATAILPWYFSGLARDYSAWLSVNFGIVWVFTLICADSDLQALWFASKIGKRLSYGLLCTVTWAFVIMFLVGISVAYNTASYYDIVLISIGLS